MGNNSLYFFGESLTGSLARAINWSTSPLGPAENWPSSLKTSLALLFRSRQPMLLLWGSQLTCFYNDAFLPNLSSIQSSLSMGQDGQQLWNELGAARPSTAKTQENYDYSPAFDDKGFVSGMLVTPTESKVTFSQFFESMPHMGFVTDPQGTVLSMNKSFCEYLDVPKNEIVNWISKNSPVIHPEDLTCTMKTWADSLRIGRPFQQEYRLRRHDGEYRWHLGRANPVWSKQDQIIQWHGTNTDIHEQKMHELALITAKESAEQSNRSKSEFLASMSHEIRTPLGAILGFTELLKEIECPKEKHEYAKIIERNGKILTKIIDDILDLSKVEAGRLSLESIDFSLHSLAEEILRLFLETSKNKNISLSLSIDPRVPQFVKSDPTRIRQVLINLVGNAVKFTPNGDIRVHIQPLFEDDSLVKIKFFIQDTGIGMSESQAEKLFKPFSQADCSTTRKFGGSGLGLILSRRLARALGGDVVLEKCEPQAGCTFSATFCVMPAARNTKFSEEPLGAQNLH